MINVDYLPVKDIKGEPCVETAGLPYKAQQHIKNHSLRKEQRFILVPCACPGGGHKEFVHKRHLKELLSDYGNKISLLDPT